MKRQSWIGLVKTRLPEGELVRFSSPLTVGHETSIMQFADGYRVLTLDGIDTACMPDIAKAVGLAERLLTAADLANLPEIEPTEEIWRILNALPTASPTDPMEN